MDGVFARLRHFQSDRPPFKHEVELPVGDQFSHQRALIVNVLYDTFLGAVLWDFGSKWVELPLAQKDLHPVGRSKSSDNPIVGVENERQALPAPIE